MNLLKSFVFTALTILFTSLYAQTSPEFHYQTVLRDASGQVMPSADYDVTIQILKGNSEGVSVFSETHNVSSNEFGLINIRVGSVNALDNIQWGENLYFIQISINGNVMGTSQLLSVPFALHAFTSADLFDGNFNSLINTPDLESFIEANDPQSGDMMFFSNGMWQVLNPGEEGQLLRIFNSVPRWVDPDYDGTITDVDGNIYSTVFIGDQEWMAENLRTTRYRDGSDIDQQILYPYSQVPGIDSDDQMLLFYGRLYNFSAVTDERGLCPAGWHVPSDEEWTVLTDYLADNDDLTEDILGNSLKSCRQVNSPLGSECITSEHPRWDAHTVHSGKDSHGFDGTPAGYFYFGTYNEIGRRGYWWTSTSANPGYAWGRVLLYDYGYMFRYDDYATHMGLSVRCIRD